MCARALRYCSMCTMSQMVAQQVCGEGCYTQSRPFGRLDLREVCGERHRCSTCTAFGAQLQISSCRCLPGANGQNRWNSADARHSVGSEHARLCCADWLKEAAMVQMHRILRQGRKRTLQDHLSHIHKNWKVNSPNSPWSIPSRDKEIDRMGIARRVTYVSTARSALITPRVMCLPLGW